MNCVMLNRRMTDRCPGRLSTARRRTSPPGSTASTISSGRPTPWTVPAPRKHPGGPVPGHLSGPIASAFDIASLWNLKGQGGETSPRESTASTISLGRPTLWTVPSPRKHLQGYLAHKKTRTHLGLPWGPRHKPTVGS